MVPHVTTAIIGLTYFTLHFEKSISGQNCYHNALDFFFFPPIPNPTFSADIILISDIVSAANYHHYTNILNK